MEDNKVTENKHFTRETAPYRHSSIRVCKDCGKFFVMSDSDLLYFVDKYNSIPCRCSECRQKIREKYPINKTENE